LINDDLNNLDAGYVNASYINGPLSSDTKAFIAMQGPINNTISKFWRLIFEKNTKLIVMLCKTEEDCRVNKVSNF
jgi:protein tyrosine phosphatase